MTWLFVLVLLHADGTTTETQTSGLTESECHSTERAWLGAFNHREVRMDAQTDVVVKIRCEKREPRR